jgi:tRNA(adenine34) deaminase
MKDVRQMQSSHEHFMHLALDQAARAQAMGEVPIGAVLIDGEGKVLAQGCNQPISSCDPTAHAEIMVLRQAAREVKNYRLLSTTLYVTLEPCVMCMGGLIHARVARIIFGASDAKWGAAGSLYDFSTDTRLNHHPEIVAGICESQCRLVITDFFKGKRR